MVQARVKCKCSRLTSAVTQQLHAKEQVPEGRGIRVYYCILVLVFGDAAPPLADVCSLALSSAGCDGKCNRHRNPVQILRRYEQQAA